MDSRYLRSAKAFTLIELLVVISIVALLVAVLLPALEKARITARTIQCLSQERQMAIAALNYATEDAKYALPYNAATTHGGSSTSSTDVGRNAWWMVDIARYMGGGQASNYSPSEWPSKTNAVDKNVPGLLCPETYKPTGQYWLAKAYGRSYSYNTLVTTGRPWRPGASTWTPTTKSWYVPPVNLDQMAGPLDKIVMVGDGWQYGATGWGIYSTSATATNYQGKSHGPGKLNFVFMDGHAATIKKGDRSDLQLYDRPIKSYYAWGYGF